MAKPIVLISGASGYTGSNITQELRQAGYTVHAMVRHRDANYNPTAGVVAWNTASGAIDLPDDGAAPYAIVHLAGASTLVRWTKTRKEAIRSSRVDLTRNLVQHLLDRKHQPAAFICASGPSTYGDRGDTVLTESSAVGINGNFLTEIGVAWEEAAAAISAKGARCAHLRFGAVMHHTFFRMNLMLFFARLGMLGTMGPGGNYMPWVSLRDTVRAVRHVLETDTISGPVNIVSPNQTTQKEMVAALSRTIKRPALLRVPMLVPRILFGELAGPFMAASQRAVPAVLQDTGFEWEHPHFEDVLRYMLDRET